MKRDQRPEQRRVRVGGHRLRAIDPGENLLVGNIEPALVFPEFGLAHGRKPRVGEGAEHQIHFADAAMARTEQQTPAPRVQSLARKFAQSQFSNGKNPAGAGCGIYIKATATNVSGSFPSPRKREEVR